MEVPQHHAVMAKCLDLQHRIGQMLWTHPFFNKTSYKIKEISVDTALLSEKHWKFQSQLTLE